MHKVEIIELGKTFEDAKKAYDDRYKKIVNSFSWWGEDDYFMGKECDALRCKVLPVIIKRAETLEQCEMVLRETNDRTNELRKSVEEKMELLQIGV
ncbi:MAG: hypothetical protein PHX34_03565 [Candidatus Shapirobacteria bacterium]|nr:hypothetical protein [Candidatus Shapirobacteria bacterium]